MTAETPALFFSDNTEKSQKARQLLINNNIQFQELILGTDYEIDESDPLIPPCIQGRYGDFRGIGAVIKYIAISKADPQ